MGIYDRDDACLRTSGRFSKTSVRITRGDHTPRSWVGGYKEQTGADQARADLRDMIALRKEWGMR